MINKCVLLVRKFCTREIISYLICGVLTTILAIIIYGFCIRLELSVVFSNTIATVIAVLFAYLLNRIFVFQSKVRGFVPICVEFAKFSSGRLITYVLETGLLILLALLFGESDMMKFICKIFTTTLVVVLNYFISKCAVFR